MFKLKSIDWYLAVMLQKVKKKEDKNIQQWVFAGGHPPNY
jgi:hypothetical protein